MWNTESPSPYGYGRKERTVLPGRVCRYVNLGLLTATMAGAADLDYAVIATLGVRSEVGYLGGRVTIPRTERPATLSSEPEYPSPRPLYLTVQLGNAERPAVVMALASSTGPDGQPDRLYVDRDRDGDLREEVPYEATRYGRTVQFAPVHVLTDHGSHHEVYHFAVVWYKRTGRCEIRSCCYRVGSLAVGGKEYRVAVADANGNGLFNDRVTASEKGDALFIDLDGHGEWSNVTECQELGQYNRVKGVYYSFTVEPDGSRITVTKPEVQWGRIRFASPVRWIGLRSESGWFWFSGKDRDGVDVPPGSYRLSNFTLAKRTDAAGNSWEAGGTGAKAKMAPCVVRVGEASRMELGPPFRLELTARQRYGSLDIQGTITGQAGENYTSTERNGNELPPTITINDPAGRALASATPEYG
ncbi:MAG: hypothetical protein HON70_24355 [Lentisphaerae bacterium]|nr:hypothetical protein [Lentisphaerota bacterium]